MRLKSNFHQLIYVLGSAAATGSAFAHPGHGITESTPAHILTSPYHLLTLALSGGALAGTAWFVRSRKAQVTMRACGITMMVVAAILHGAHV